MRKTVTSVSINPELLHYAKMKGIILSQFLEQTLGQYLGQTDTDEEKLTQLTKENQKLATKIATNKAIIAEIQQKKCKNTEKMQENDQKKQRLALIKEKEEYEKERKRKCLT